MCFQNIFTCQLLQCRLKNFLNRSIRTAWAGVNLVLSWVVTFLWLNWIWVYIIFWIIMLLNRGKACSERQGKKFCILRISHKALTKWEPSIHPLWFQPLPVYALCLCNCYAVQCAQMNQIPKLLLVYSQCHRAATTNSFTFSFGSSEFTQFPFAWLEGGKWFGMWWPDFVFSSSDVISCCLAFHGLPRLIDNFMQF